MTEPEESEWLGEHAPADAEFIDRAPGGALSDAGRRMAVESSLGLLGLYFSSGDQEIVERSAIGVDEANRELDELRAGLRLRVALAAGSRLSGSLEAIARRPTFRYELQTASHVGSLNGALDITRWVTRPRGGDQDVTFPVLEVTRGAKTPENTLAAYATVWLLQELKVSFAASLATPDVVEYRVMRKLSGRMERMLQLPALAECVREARSVRTVAAIHRLLTQVRTRLQRREIANAMPYRDLVAWIEKSLAGAPAVTPGDTDLSVYGDRFDNKLFELWCLGAVARGLAQQLNLPEPMINRGWRSGEPAYRLEGFAGRIDLHFQRGLTAVDKAHAARWAKEGGRRLGGIPDIVAQATPTVGVRRYAVVDPKLRQRDRLPAEELYKVLGYLQNFKIDPAVGVVLLYTTRLDAAKADVFYDGESGTLISVALNPAAAPDVTAAAIEPVLRVLLSLIGYQAPVEDENPADDTPDELSTEEQAERSISAVRSSVTAWGKAHLSEIGPSRERIATLVGDRRWQALDVDVQVMMATADLVGHQLDPTADFSGPVIGMCAAIEHLIHSTMLLPVVASDAAKERQTRTFGAAIDVVELACRGRGGNLSREIKAHVEQLHIDANDVLALLPLWRGLNSKFRIPAAHRAVVTKSGWQQLYRLVMGAETLFIRTHDALYRAASTKEA